MKDGNSPSRVSVCPEGGVSVHTLLAAIVGSHEDVTMGRSGFEVRGA